jgi:hypothetical protein
MIVAITCLVAIRTWIPSITYLSVPGGIENIVEKELGFGGPAAP